MDGFNVNKIILGLQNPELFLKKLKPEEQTRVNSFLPEINSALNNTKPQQNNILQNLKNLTDVTKMLQMNTLANTDRAIFVKTLLGLPQDLGQLLMSLQNPNKPLNGGTLGITGLNQDLLNNQKTLATLFNENAPIDINNSAIAANIQQNAQVKNDAVHILLFSGMISLPDFSQKLIQNGKHAVTNLILAMAYASKQGIDSEQLQSTLGIINSCIAMAESDSPAQSLKSLMMLYLPWLPLNEEVDFDLEITPQDGENESNNSKLTVLIQTKNFGNIKGEFILTTSNSIDISIICSESFPKNILKKQLAEESTMHAMNTNIDIEAIQPKKEEIKVVHETKVNLSATNEMNPYLLLMAHSFIRNTVLIDNNA